MNRLFKFNTALVPFIALFGLTACSTTSTGGAPSSQANAKSDTRMPASAACYTSKIGGGNLPEGVEVVATDLNNSLFGKATEKVYGEGSFPTDYQDAFVDVAHPSPSKHELLSNAIAWGWEIEPKKDATGAWTVLTMYKQILYSVDGEGYRVDEREVQYGQSLSITDADSGVIVNCTLPSK